MARRSEFWWEELPDEEDEDYSYEPINDIKTLQDTSSESENKQNDTVLKRSKDLPPEYDPMWYQLLLVDEYTAINEKIYNMIEEYAYIVRDFNKAVSTVFYKQVGVQPKNISDIDLSELYSQEDIDVLADRLKSKENEIFCKYYSAPKIFNAHVPLKRLQKTAAKAWFIYNSSKVNTELLDSVSRFIFEKEVKKSATTEEENILLTYRQCQVLNKYAYRHISSRKVALPKYFYRAYERFNYQQLFDEIMKDLGCLEIGKIGQTLDRIQPVIDNLRSDPPSVNIRNFIHIYDNWQKIDSTLFEINSTVQANTKLLGEVGEDAMVKLNKIRNFYCHSIEIFKGTVFSIADDDCAQIVDRVYAIFAYADDYIKNIFPNTWFANEGKKALEDSYAELPEGIRQILFPDGLDGAKD